MIRRIKLAYEIYNFFHKKELEHNIKWYKKYGLKKKYYSSISSEDFKNIEPDQLLKEKREKELHEIPFYGNQSKEIQESIGNFDELGYCIVKHYLSEGNVDQINTEISRLLDNKEIKFKYRNKLMSAIHKSEIINSICRDKNLKELLDYLIKGDAKLFQSINFLRGSEQETHSDSIHMTTFPLGGLLGVWIALEDISMDNGPIHYYPKSHKLPYYTNRDYDNLGSKFLLGNKGYTAYEAMIQRKVKEQKMEKHVFEAKSGDMFIWHANFLHGGEPHIDKTRSRKSMVLHYFDFRRICYHEITQRPALLKKGYS